MLIIGACLVKLYSKLTRKGIWVLHNKPRKPFGGQLRIGVLHYWNIKYAAGYHSAA